MPESGEPRESEALRVYLRLKALFGGGGGGRRRARREPEESGSLPFAPGRDPASAGGVLDGLIAELGWTGTLSQGELMASWEELVGEATAERSRPVGIENGVLLVQCDSTAWATQLRLMRDELLRQLAERFPDARVESIRFQGPDVPSWKRGPRTIPGRGPRDTYG